MTETKYISDEQRTQLQGLYNTMARKRQAMKELLQESEENMTVLYLLSTGARIQAEPDDEVRMLLDTCSKVAKACDCGLEAATFYQEYKKFLVGKGIETEEETRRLNPK